MRPSSHSILMRRVRCMTHGTTWVHQIVPFLYAAVCLLCPTAAAAASDNEQHTVYAIATLEGHIGLDITGDRIQQLTQDLHTYQHDNPSYTDALLVLRIASDGGEVAALPGISDALFAARSDLDMRIVVWVDRAVSAAAIAALNAPEIVMTPDGFMGGAITVDHQGKPITHSDLHRALFIGRACALRGEHDEVIAVAMQTGNGLIVQSDGCLTNASDDQPSPDSEIIARQGEPAVLNARQASVIGLSIGEAANMEQLRSLLGLTVSDARAIAVEDRDRGRALAVSAVYRELEPHARRVRAALEGIQPAHRAEPIDTIAICEDGLAALAALTIASNEQSDAATHVLSYLGFSARRIRIAQDALQNHLDEQVSPPR